MRIKQQEYIWQAVMNNLSLAHDRICKEGTSKEVIGLSKYILGLAKQRDEKFIDLSPAENKRPFYDQPKDLPECKR